MKYERVNVVEIYLNVKLYTFLVMKIYIGAVWVVFGNDFIEVSRSLTSSIEVLIGFYYPLKIPKKTFRFAIALTFYQTRVAASSKILFPSSNSWWEHSTLSPRSTFLLTEIENFMLMIAQSLRLVLMLSNNNQHCIVYPGIREFQTRFNGCMLSCVWLGSPSCQPRFDSSAWTLEIFAFSWILFAVFAWKFFFGFAVFGEGNNQKVWFNRIKGKKSDKLESTTFWTLTS